MKQILPQDLSKTVQQYILLDVRTPEEYSEGHLQNSTNIPVENIIEKVFDTNKLPKDSQYLIYCQSGARSYGACEYLDKLGYNTTNLIGGITAWTGQGLPVS